MKEEFNKTPKLTKVQKDALAVLAATPEQNVDTSEISELTANDFARAVRLESLYKPRKKQITARIDADSIFWLKSKGGHGYQSRLNAILREAMKQETQVSKSGTTKRATKGPPVAQKRSLARGLREA